MNEATPDEEDRTLITDRSLIGRPAREPRSEICHVLTISRGPDRGRSYVLDLSVVRLGRGQSCEICVNDESVSRVHAVMLVDEGEWVLVDAGSSNGTFVANRKIRRHELREGDEFQLGTRARFRFTRVVRAQADLMVELFESSVRDSLTGARNRRSFDARLRSEMAFALRHGTDLAVLMLDVDLFKRVNDTFGHAAGDIVLRELASTVRGMIRAEDFFARFGGEELVILTPGIDARGACALAERIRFAIEHLLIEAGERTIHLTVSIGVATLETSGRPTDGASLVQDADARMYEAKELGRNRVIGPMSHV